MDIILELMKKEAKELNIDEMKIEKSITLKSSKNSKGNIEFNYPKDNSGVVYAFAIRLNDNEKQKLFKEAKEKGTARISSVEQIKEIENGLCMLYWGKSILNLGRLNAHLKAHKGTGTLHLCEYESLNNKEIYYSIFMVSERVKLEKHLINRYVPILKTKSN